MQPKKQSKYECHYPSVAEDSAYHYANCNWQYADSLRTHHAKYKDSVAVDWVYSEKTGNFETVYAAKGEDYIDTSNHSTAGEAQYYIVPLFIAIMTVLIIFAFVLYRDNAAALSQKKQDNIMDFINNK